MSGPRRILSISLLATAAAAGSAPASDWPQFMRCPERTGDAADEKLEMPLGLVAQVKLDDAILTSPAVVDGRVYVVDQMGPAYCLDPDAGRILWKSAPDGEKAMGSNTSSPCVAKGRVCYGTTAGSFHILDAADGKLVKTIRLGWPIIGSPTFANDSVYFQTLDAVVHCLDLDGQESWQWDHYGLYADQSEEKKRPPYKGRISRGRGLNQPHYGGNEVTVSGKRVVTSSGCDLYCLEDKATEASLVWITHPPALLGKHHPTPRATAISGGYIYTPCPGSDGAAALLRVSLEDGSFDPKRDSLGPYKGQWAILGTPAVRDPVVYFGRQAGVTAWDMNPEIQDKHKRVLWSTCTRGPKDLNPVVSSPALSKEHCLFTTLTGELLAVRLSARPGRYSTLADLKPFRFKTPYGKPITSSPVISGGRVYFGCDDGCLYVLGPGGDLEPKKENLTLHQPRSRAVPATGRRYAWPSPFGGPGNTCFVEDPELKPPFRVRWALRSFGMFKQPVSATAEDVLYVSLSGLVACLEQGTGRLRWRRRLPGQGTGFSYRSQFGLLCAGGRVYVPRAMQGARSYGLTNALFCLDGATGETRWQAELGAGACTRAAPVLADGIIAFGFCKFNEDKTPVSVIAAWDAAGGEPAWQVKLRAGSGRDWSGLSGCALDGVMFFSAGVGDRKKGWSGETVAINSRTGKVLWRTEKACVKDNCTLSARDGRVYVPSFGPPTTCLSAKDGRVIWQKSGRKSGFEQSLALGPDYLAGRGRSGPRMLSDGAPKKVGRKDLRLGGWGHSCGSFLLTSGGLSLATTVYGLFVTDVETGKVLWKSLGFFPRTCSNPIAANGRVFYVPQVDGVLYCFEPVPGAAPGRR